LRKKNKSDQYQYKIVEIPIDPHILNEISNNNGLSYQVCVSEYSIQFEKLQKELFDELKKIIKSDKLTKRQKDVMLLRVQGKTQIEIADTLNIHQTTVHKTINGNIDYKNCGKLYGGAIKKIRKLCLKNEKIIEILEEINELKHDEDSLDDQRCDFDFSKLISNDDE
jgi:transcriptional regulator